MDYKKMTIAGKQYFFKNEENKKFEKDVNRVKTILEKPEITTTDKMELLNIYSASFHKDGKIEGSTSFDSTATNCAFCQKMCKAAEKNPSHICGMCYDKKQEGYKKFILNRHTLNMIIMSNVFFTKDELSRVSCTKINRINSSGDTPNLTYAINMLNLASVNPWAVFGYWTKNIKVVEAACDKVGKPENVSILQSSCIIGKKVKKSKYADYTFTVYPDEETTTAAINNGACACNGKKCKNCGWKCYYKTWTAGADIAELLRGASKAKINAIKKSM